MIYNVIVVVNGTSKTLLSTIDLESALQSADNTHRFLQWLGMLPMYDIVVEDENGTIYQGIHR